MPENLKKNLCLVSLFLMNWLLNESARPGSGGKSAGPDLHIIVVLSRCRMLWFELGTVPLVSHILMKRCYRQGPPIQLDLRGSSCCIRDSILFRCLHLDPMFILLLCTGPGRDVL